MTHMTPAEINLWPNHGLVADHETEGLVDDEVAGYWSGPLDLSKRDDVLEMERVRSLYADLIEGQPSDQQIHQRVETARSFIGQFTRACRDLFFALTEVQNVVVFGDWRITVVDRSIPSLGEDELFRAHAAVRSIARELSPKIRARLLAIPTSTLVDQRLYWISADCWKICPPPFVSACEELSEAISNEVIRRILRMQGQGLQGCVSPAGVSAAHCLADPGRWPTIGFGHIEKLQAAIIDSGGWVSGSTLRVAGESQPW